MPSFNKIFPSPKDTAENICSVVKNSFGRLTTNGIAGNRFNNSRQAAAMLAATTVPTGFTESTSGIGIRYFTINYSLIEGSDVVGD